MVAGTADHPGYKNASGVFTMPTTSLIFGGDEITNIPTNSGLSLTSIAPTASDFIFNYGAAASVSTAAGSSLVSVTLQVVSGGTGTINHETLFAGGSSAIYAGASTNIVFTGTGAQATAFLDNAYVVDSTNSDKFKIKILASDGVGGNNSVAITYSTACFVAGTRIATPDGEVAVESLAAGNMVTTQEGDRRVAWIGTRTYEADMLRAEPWLRPVEIRRGALGRGLPRRDLLVSPEHAMLVDGVLVRASALVNGRTIFHAPINADVTYFHVELENEHGILFAEGAPTESFRDEGSRVLFDNAAEHTLAHGMAPALPPLAAPRADEGYQLETIRHRLAGGMDEVPAGSIRGHVERLTDGVLEGWIMDAANPLVPVEIEIRIEGKPVGRTIANGYRTDLHRAGIGVGRAGFRFVLPTGCDDLRAVSVVRAFDGANLPVAATVTV
jgi:hypothetical protein